MAAMQRCLSANVDSREREDARVRTVLADQPGGAPAAPSGFSAAAAFDAPVVSPRRRGAGTQLPANV